MKRNRNLQKSIPNDQKIYKNPFSLATKDILN